VVRSHVDIPRGAANFKIFADTIKNAATEHGPPCARIPIVWRFPLLSICCSI
jgi:hypothetical protein